MTRATDRFEETRNLFALLAHYARLDEANREAWQDRLMQRDGALPRDLVKWHGQLLAQGWIEQHTAIVPTIHPGTVPGCYRITRAGHRALRRARSDGDFVEDGARAA